jgi:C_GCAxxG_C_C family probable redox protein
VVLAVGEYLWGECPDLLRRASHPFGGGLGSSKEEICGVLSGGALVLGAWKGRATPGEDDKAFYALLRQFRERFLERAGSTQCKVIFDGFPEKTKRCWPLVVEGTRLLLEMMEKM